MRLTTASISLALAALASAGSSNGTSAPLNAVPSSWDGVCYYPKPDIGFQLESYLGKWYQVAGTVAPFTAGCKCIQAQYELNVRDHPAVVEHRTSKLALIHNRTTAPSPSTTPARRKARRSTSWAPLLRRIRLMALRVFSRLDFRDRLGLRARGQTILFRVSFGLV